MCVAEVSNNRYLKGIIDCNALFFQFDNLRAGKIGKFLFYFFSFFYYGEADGPPAVLCGEYTCDQVRFYLEFVAGLDAYEIGGKLVAVETSPGIDDVLNGREEVFGRENGARGLSAEIAMREVIGDTCGVIHMAVCEQDVIYGYNLVGGLADIEADVELRHSDDGFFAGNRIADYVQVINRNLR